MFIEAIIVCVNYSDFLRITLPLNLPFLDHVIILTDNKDEDTVNFYKELNSNKISIVKTDDFYLNGAKFNKGLVINYGYKFLKHKDWVLNLDSDIYLGDDFRNKLEDENLNKEFFYGSPRRDLKTFENWSNFIEKIEKPENFIKYRGSGYGFHALYNFNSSIFQRLNKTYNNFPYPFWIPNASESDWIFRNAWGERVFHPPLGKFPECHFEKNEDYDSGLYKELSFECYHLGEVGKNHNCRVTPNFK